MPIVGFGLIVATLTVSVAEASGGMVVPSNGFVTTLFLESPYPESWFPTYYDQSNLSRPRPAGGAHSGVDISNGFVDCTNPVYPAASGTVVWTGFDTGGFGWSIVVAHGSNVGASGHVTYTVYGHLGTAGATAGSSQSCLVTQVNQPVSVGTTTLGYQGSSGNATGTHVHWMILIGAVVPGTITGPYLPGFVPASPDFYTCLPLTAGDPSSLSGQRVTTGQSNCPTTLTPRVVLPLVEVGSLAGW